MFLGGLGRYHVILGWGFFGGSLSSMSQYSKVLVILVLDAFSCNKKVKMSFKLVLHMVHV